MAVGLVDLDGRVLRAARPARRTVPTRGPVSPSWSDRCSTDGRGDDGIVAVGVGCGGPMTAGGETVSPLNIPGWRGFPLRSRLRELTGLDVCGRQRRQGTGPRRGVAGRGAGRRRLHRHGREHRRRRRHRAGRPPARRRRRRTPATSAISSWSRTGGPARAGAEAAWRRRRRGWPSPPSPAARRPRRRSGDPAAHRPPGRSGRGRRVRAARSPPRRGGRLGGARLRRRVLRRRAGGARPARRGSATPRGARIVPAGLGADGPLVGAAAVGAGDGLARLPLAVSSSAHASDVLSRGRGVPGEGPRVPGRAPPAGLAGHRPARGRRAASASCASGGRRSTSTATSAPGWPTEYGGAGLSALEQVILAEEFTKAGVPTGGTNDVFGIQMLGNTLQMWGTDEQKTPLPARGSSRARTRGARATRSRTPARTSATSGAGRCSTATSGSSTVRRCGPRPGTWPTTSSCWPAPIPTPRSTRASASSWSTCASRASRCGRSG